MSTPILPKSSIPVSSNGRYYGRYAYLAFRLTIWISLSQGYLKPFSEKHWQIYQQLTLEFDVPTPLAERIWDAEKSAHCDAVNVLKIRESRLDEVRTKRQHP